jgi:hypothetical protein
LNCNVIIIKSKKSSSDFHLPQSLALCACSNLQQQCLFSISNIHLICMRKQKWRLQIVFDLLAQNVNRLCAQSWWDFFKNCKTKQSVLRVCFKNIASNSTKLQNMIKASFFQFIYKFSCEFQVMYVTSTHINIFSPPFIFSFLNFFPPRSIHWFRNYSR